MASPDHQLSPSPPPAPPGGGGGGPPRSQESDHTMRQRLVNSLSQSFPGSALSKALSLMDSDEVDGERLSSSCFAEIRLDKRQDEDDELTSLSWLQDTNILKDIADEEEQVDDKDEVLTVEEKPRITLQSPYNPLKHVSNKPPYSFSCLIFMAIEDSPIKRLPVKDIYNWILTHFPYFQNAPTGWKNSVRHNLSLNKCFKKVDKERGHTLGKGSLWCIDPDYRPNLLQALRKTPYHPYHQLQMMNTSVNNNEYGCMIAPSPLVAQRVNFNTPSPRLFPFLSKRLAQSKQEPEDSVLDIDVAKALVSLKGNAASRSLDSARWRELTMARDQVRKRHRSASPPEFGSEAYRRRKLKETPENVVFTRSPSEDHTYSVPEKRHPSSRDDRRSSSSDERNPLSDVDELSDSSYHSSSDDDDDDDLGVLENGRKQPTDEQVALPVKKRFRSLLQFDHNSVDDQVKEGASALLNLAGIRTGLNVPLRSISPCNNNNNMMKQQVTV